MPRGGHMGLWKPTPKDIFKSRWKRFYKRCYRPRKLGNNVDAPTPHPQQASGFPDGVPSPWKLNYSLGNFPEGNIPQDMRRGAANTYRANIGAYLRPIELAREGTAQDVILRCLDAGRRRGAASNSGYGRLEARWGRTAVSESESSSTRHMGQEVYDDTDDHVPNHILTLQRHQRSTGDQQEAEREPFTTQFQFRRLYELCEEKEIVWDGGLNDPRRLDASDSGAGGRGHFPYIDEKAGLLDELMLKDILRLGHRTNSRRHPKWTEIQFWYKKWHRQYLRRREMLKDEVKSRMGVLKQALPE